MGADGRGWEGGLKKTGDEYLSRPRSDRSGVRHIEASGGREPLSLPTSRGLTASDTGSQDHQV